MQRYFGGQATVASRYGNRPTPPPGASIKKVEIRSDDYNGYFERMKDRFVWFPFADLNYIGKLGHMPLSTDYIYRGRIAWLQSISYQTTDNTIDAFDTPGDDEMPLRRLMLTPYAQEMYLYESNHDRGFIVLDHLRGQNPEMVAILESIILPEVPETLIDLGNYLMNNGVNNISAANLDSKTHELAQKTLAAMIEGVNVAVNFCQTRINESEGEILNRRNKGTGKASLDNLDRYSYAQLNREIPMEATLENSGEAKTNALLEKLITGLANGRGVVEATPDTVKDDEIRALKTQLAQLAEQFLSFQATLPKTETAPADLSKEAPEPEENVQADLKKRFDNQQGQKPRR